MKFLVAALLSLSCSVQAMEISRDLGEVENRMENMQEAQSETEDLEILNKFQGEVFLFVICDSIQNKDTNAFIQFEDKFFDIDKKKIVGDSINFAYEEKVFNFSATELFYRNAINLHKILGKMVKVLKRDNTLIDSSDLLNAFYANENQMFVVRPRPRSQSLQDFDLEPKTSKKRVCSIY